MLASVIKFWLFGLLTVSAAVIEPRGCKDYPIDVSGAGNGRKPAWGEKDIRDAPYVVNLFLPSLISHQQLMSLRYHGKCSKSRQQCDFLSHAPRACMKQQLCKRDMDKCYVVASRKAGGIGPGHCQSRPQ